MVAPATSAVHPHLLSDRASSLFPDAAADYNAEYTSLVSAAQSHPAVFLDCFCRIYDPTLKREFPFHLWDWQWEFLAWVMRSENKRIVVLKARQLGVSWLVAGYALWMAIFHPNTHVLLVSRIEGVASDLLAKCAFMYNRLPDVLRPPLSRRHDKNNTTELYWHLINSRISALASTPSSGRSSSASLVIADEWADHPFAEEMFTGYEPTVGAEGQVIGVSTAKGRANFFYRTYMGAKRRENDFIPFFLSALLHPGYTADFLAGKRRTYESAGELWRYHREYAVNDMEAFGGSTDTFFPAPLMERLFAAVRAPDWVPPESPWFGNLHVWSRPRYGMRYTIGADPADTGPDRSVGIVLESVSGRHVATLRSPTWSPYEFAALLNALGRLYAADPAVESSFPVLAVERNNHGIAVLEALSNVHRYPNLYYGREGGRVRKSVLGWLTTKASRPVMLSDLKAAVVDGSWNTEDDVMVDEMAAFEEDGKYDGHDDHVFAGGIAWQARSAFPVVRGTRRTAALAR